MTSLLITHIAFTWFLLGLIWTIQVVHYPLLINVGQSEFRAYHQRHMTRVSWVVVPLMFAEVGSAAWLLCLGEQSSLFLISLYALAIVWISTFVFQVPLHEKLAQGYSSAMVNRLVWSNWLRTIAWSVRGLCLLSLLLMKTC